jgi:hypothetical protein
MLLEQVTDSQIQAGRVLAGATMAAFLAAPLFRRCAHPIRLTVAAIYCAAVLGFLLYYLL